MSHYRLVIESEKTDYRVADKSPTKALRELVTLAGLSLASQDGRYGRLDDGRSVTALTEAWGRANYSDARTTRTLR